MEKAQNSIPALTSRRNFIASGAALAVASVSPALAFPSGGQDAELIELGRQLEVVTAKWWASNEPIKRLGDISRSQYPQLPLVLKSRPTDSLFGLPEANDGRYYEPTGGGNREEPGYYTINHLSELKRLKPKQTVEITYEQYFHERFGPAAPFPANHAKSDIVVTRAAWPEAQARIDELLAAIEGWRKACRRIDHATGYMKAQRDFQRLANKVFALDDKIVEIEAKSLEGLRVKARTLQLIYWDDQEEMGFGETTDQVLALSIVKGLLALQDPQS